MGPALPPLVTLSRTIPQEPCTPEQPGLGIASVSTQPFQVAKRLSACPLFRGGFHSPTGFGAGWQRDLHSPRPLCCREPLNHFPCLCQAWLSPHQIPMWGISSTISILPWGIKETKTSVRVRTVSSNHTSVGFILQKWLWNSTAIVV